MKTVRNAGAIDYSEEEKNKIMADKIKNGSLKKMDVKEDLKALEKEEAERDLKKKLFTTQRSYRRAVKNSIKLDVELEEMYRQIETNDITMEWFGAAMPLNIAKAMYNCNIENLVDAKALEKELKDILLKEFKLTEKDIENIMDGKYVKEIRD
jgi:hypothetical protein